ncbi:hypothetical protein [Deinococcus marmoris]|uniref:hypothetical protein n=1 Tax=Deinococcus marmoris TaxID=249408 RepID=UPI000690DC90|nr:hypothetical protein [Deinococcus marmoris]
MTDYNSKIVRWSPATSQLVNTFDSQSLSPKFNFGVKGFLGLKGNNVPTSLLTTTGLDVQLHDARDTNAICDLWITDPPYADAIDYEEISEFFLSWYEKRIPMLFPEWYADAKRILAVKGKGVSFNEAMMQIYTQLTAHMPDNGLQVVMFTHQDAGVWAELAMTLWASGLQVSAAWTVVTETTDGLSGGANNVQATVLLVLRKRGEVETVFDDDILNLMEDEVAKQLKDMQLLEGAGLAWSDADLQLATYAAALRVITSHNIHGLDPHKELLKVRARGEKSPVHLLIEQAAQAATRNLLPRGLDAAVWRDLESHERFYLKGLDTEQKGEHRSGVFQELARSYAASAWRDLLADDRANNVRLMTASEMGGRNVNTGPLAGTLLRHLLLAIQITAREDGPAQGLAGLRDDVPNFAMQHSRAITLLEHLGRLTLPHWKADAEAAQVLRGALMNAGV